MCHVIFNRSKLSFLFQKDVNHVDQFIAINLVLCDVIFHGYDFKKLIDTNLLIMLLNYTPKKVWQELPPSMDKLPETRYKERKILLRRRRCYHSVAQYLGKQVREAYDTIFLHLSQSS